MIGGLLYEPRSFWEVRSIDALDPTDNPEEQRVVFDNRRWYNSQRWPITITNITFAMIDYVLKRYANTGAFSPHGYVAASNIFMPRITISVRHRASFSKQPYAVASYANTPTADRCPPADITGQLFSSFNGYNFFKFDMPLELPADANIQFDLTNFNGVPTGSSGVRVRWATAFHEKLYADIRQGEARVFGGFLSTASSDTQSPFGAPVSPLVLVPNNDLTSALFPPSQAITPKNFAQQSPIASNSPIETRVSKFTGISVAIDQIDYDDAVATALGGALFPPSPLSLRTGVRARVRAGGSQTEWWEPGAPLALVMPTITPASVYTLERPITLAPGDQMEIELAVPPEQLVAVDQGPDVLAPATYKVGVAANGFVAIEM